MFKGTVRVEGLKELDAALAQLPRSLQKGVLTRTLKKAGQPIAEAAAARAPRDTGELAGSIIVAPRIKNTVGNKEFSDVMKSGGTLSEARSALRSARRAAKATASTAVMYVGPSKATTKKDAMKRIVQEFGSKKQPAQPYMRPAWDRESGTALEIIKSELGAEILRTANRAARRKAKAAK